MNELKIVFMVLSFVLVILTLTIYPYIEGSLKNTGTQLADSVNMTVDTTTASAAIGQLWSFGVIVIVFASIIYAATGDE